jgi:UDPglucose 6-dehydrogenase
VSGYDPDAAVVDDLKKGKPPIFEPGLSELIADGMAAGRLKFTSNLAEAAADSDVVWITFDTPVDEDDRADVEFVARQAMAVIPHMRSGALMLISSQVPVGFTRRMEEVNTNPDILFAYSPENLRLGKALDVFRHPDRVVAGVRNDKAKRIVEELLRPFTSNIEWMRVESAEMTKHALNAFLATSVSFINEIAAVSEQVGADAKEVERGLKTDVRIGPRAYLGPGGAFAGGTLARDIEFLSQLGREKHVPTVLISAVRSSNDEHKNWPRRKLKELISELKGSTVAILGLTYKPGTDTLRRSSAVELCRWLQSEGAKVQAFDPAVGQIAEGANLDVQLCHSAMDALRGADAAVIATEWPEFRELSATQVMESMKRPIVVDANRFLAKQMESVAGLTYIAVGRHKGEA